MPAMATNADGNYIFLALEDASGNQIIIRAARSDLTTWTRVYEPGTGSAANVAMVPGDPDLMLFYGNFGTDVVVILHAISTGTNSDISPVGLGAKVVNALAVNPGDANEIVIAVGTDQDLKYTSDQGSNWSDWDATLGFDATGLQVLWSGDYWPHRYFVAGQMAGPSAQLRYSPNEGGNDTDATGAMSVTNIAGVEATEEAI